MRKILFGIFISFGVFFLMSHNASAASFSYNLNDYDWITSVNLGTQYCAYSYNNFGSSPSICILNSNRTKMYGLISYDLPHEKGDLAEFFIGINDNVSGNAIQGNAGLFMDNFGAIDNNYKIINIEKVVAEEYIQQGYDSSSYCANSTGVCQQYNTFNDFSDFLKLYSQIYRVSIIYTTSGSSPVGLKALNSNTPIAYCSLANGSNSSGAQCQVRLFGFTQWGYVGSSVNKEQKEEANQAISDSESSSEENSSNAKTTNLIGALSGIFTTISSTSATNCNITGDLGSINMGALNLCQGKEHFNSLIEFIGFTSLFVVVFWASYHLVRRTLGLIDWARSN